MKILTEPLTSDEIKNSVDEFDWLKGIVQVDMTELIDNDLEGALDLLSQRLVGNNLLMNISYEVVGNIGSTLLIEVSGDAFMILDMYDNTPEEYWDDNSIQFPRLLDEIQANVEFTHEQWEALCTSMDLTKDQINEIFVRATEEFDRIKEGL